MAMCLGGFFSSANLTNFVLELHKGITNFLMIVPFEKKNLAKSLFFKLYATDWFITDEYLLSKVLVWT